MEPSGHAFGVPKDKLLEIRGGRIRIAIPRITLRFIRATILSVAMKKAGEGETKTSPLADIPRLRFARFQ